MKKWPFNIQSLRSPIQHQDPNKSNLGCFQTFWKRRKEMITMLSTKNGMQEQCISPKNTLSLEASLLSSVLLPLLSLSENYWHELQIAKNLCTTHPHAHQRTFRLPHTSLQNMQWEFFPLPESKKQNESPTIGLPIRFFALDVLSNVYGHKIYRSTQGNQNFTYP